MQFSETLKGKSFKFVENLVARILQICKNRSFKNDVITKEDFEDARVVILKSSMNFTEKMLSEGKM